MRIVRVGAERIDDDARGAAIALGNFDGVHLGHQAVIAAAGAHRADGPFAAAVFDPHPRRFFQPDAPPFRLQSDAQRARAIAATGVETLFAIPFDAALSQMDDAAFVHAVLKERLGVRHVAVGFDFRFGRQRTGDAARLSVLGAACGIAVDIVDAVDDAAHAHKISSSDIRAAIAEGDTDAATRMLGRPWAVEGVVAGGLQRARGIGFPTANVPLADYARPRFGVYATRTDVGDGVWRAGVTNCGVKPTIGGVDAPLVETHLFDFDGDLYGRTIETQFLHFLRPERKFESFEALTAQIAEDAQKARSALSAAP